MASNAAGASLPPPVNVSPLIKFGRYSALTLGILWGLSRHSSLSKKEANRRDILEKKRVAEAEKKEAEKEKMLKEEMDYFNTALGIKEEPAAAAK